MRTSDPSPSEPSARRRPAGDGILPPDLVSRAVPPSPQNAGPRSPAPVAAPRIGCGFCFVTLDPADPDRGRRTFVRCEACGRLFHGACWRGACTRRGCGRTRALPAAVKPPGPLPVRPPGALHAGRLATLEDEPLGLSQGYAHFPDGAPQCLVLRNNSAGDVALPVRLGPPWVSVSRAGADPAVPAALRPGERVALVLEPDFFRPSRLSYDVPLNDDQAFQYQAGASSPGRLPCLAVLLLLLLWHVVRFAQAVAVGGGWWPSLGVAATFGLFLGWVTFVAPAWVRAVLLRVTADLFREGPHAGSPAWLRRVCIAVCRDGGGPILARLLRRLALAAGLGAVVVLLSWLPWWGVLAVVTGSAGAANSSAGGVLAFLAYSALAVAVWHRWLLAYDCDVPSGLLQTSRALWTVVLGAAHLLGALVGAFRAGANGAARK